MPQEKSPKNPAAARRAPAKSAEKVRATSVSSPEAPFSVGRFLIEIRWMFYGIFALVLAFSFISYSPLDPGFFSTTGSTQAWHNRVGALGAYLSSFFYYFLGFSAWLLVLFFAQRFVIAAWQRLYAFRHRRDKDHAPFPSLRIWRTALGFVLLFVGGLLVDTFDLVRWASYLPEGRAGGILGHNLAFHAAQAIGFLPANLAGVLCLFFGVSLFFYFSWLDVCEQLGKGICRVSAFLSRIYQGYRDRRAGRKARKAREAQLKAAQAQAQAVQAQAQQAAQAQAGQTSDEQSPLTSPPLQDIPTLDGAAMASEQDERQMAVPLSFSAADAGGTRAVGIPSYQDLPHAGTAAPQAPEVETVGIPALDELPMDFKPDTPPPMPHMPASMKSAARHTQTSGAAPAVGTAPSFGARARGGVSPTSPAAASASVHVQRPSAVIQPSARASAQTMASRQGGLFQEDNSKAYPMPGLDLLYKPTSQPVQISRETIEYNSKRIESSLRDFNIEVKVPNAYTGPVITCYELQPGPGVKGATILNRANDLARSLSVTSVRILETIENKSVMGLELPNPQRQTVYLSEIISSKSFLESRAHLPFVVGKDTVGEPVVADLVKMPHLLVAGATGSGKSVGLNAILMSFLFSKRPEELRLILVDPKMLEMSMYKDIPHLLTPVITDMKYVLNALTWCVEEMERRYKLLSMLKVRSIQSYNQKVKEAIRQGKPLIDPFSEDLEHPELLSRMPYIVVVIDELADLLLGEPTHSRAIQERIIRLAQKARAAGIHLILATQRPVREVVTGQIKANVPGRIAFRVNSANDSRIIFDKNGAESLLGKGDMMLVNPGEVPQRCHGAFVQDEEVERVTDYLRQQCGEPQYVKEVMTARESEDNTGSADDAGGEDEYDPRYDEAISVVMRIGKSISVSRLQRDMKIGFNRAARICEQMERDGILSAPHPQNKTRDVLRRSPALDALDAYEAEQAEDEAFFDR